MKKLITILLYFIVGFGTSLEAKFFVKSDIKDFQIDEKLIEKEFESVFDLEKTIAQNFSKADYNFVSTNNNLILIELGSHLNINSNNPLENDKNPILGIPSFCWGCGLGIIGVLVVTLVSTDLPKDEQKEQIKKSLSGCLVGTLISILISTATSASSSY